MLGKRAKIRVIAHLDAARPAAQSAPEELSEGDVRPAQVRGLTHQPILRTHDARNTHTGANPDRACRSRRQNLSADLSNLADDTPGIAKRVHVLTLHPSENLTTEADECCDRAVDANIQRQHHRGGRDRLDYQRWSSYPATDASTLDDEAEVDQLGDQSTHRAPIEPGCRADGRS
jgi:hypothetical protein